MTRTGSRLRAALTGLIAAAVTLGVGQLVAAFVRPAAAPMIAVGNRFIVLTPEPVKRWAIARFGTGDKTALLTGCYLVLAVAAVLIGLLAARRLRYGLAGVAVLGAVAGYCALTAPAHRAGDVLPSVLGALAGLACLAWLVHAAGRDVPGPPVRQPDGQLVTGRRRFLGTGLAAAGLAAASGIGGRLLQLGRFDANAARARIALPVPADPAPRLAGFDLGRSGVPFQTAADRFYRIDTALSVPQLDPASWRLRIHGDVRHEVQLSYADLLARPLVERWITLTCVSNEVGGDLIGTALFRGVRLADLLREAGIAAEADQLVPPPATG